jgi:ABC-type multidrug transport system ATPase subunit
MDVVSLLNLPADVAVEVVHDVSEFEEFYFLILAAFILIYMILASVFQELSTPFVMMFTIPLATIGSFWALILTGNSLFNANSMIGFLILLGVVVNNGIILIDYTNILRKKHGFSKQRALLTAGRARVRPILITAITTIVAMMPLAMGRAEYVSRIGAPFAVTVIGGLALSTLFTLIFIPTVYSGLENALNWVKRLSLKVKILQILAFGIICFLIYLNVSSFLRQVIYMLISFAVIPGFTWFFTTSLRQARADYIKQNEPLKLTIRRIVKIYDTYSRFTREWRKGERMTARFDSQNGNYTGKEFSLYVWQIPLLVFLIYFTYFYIESKTWLFIMSVPIYFYLFILIKPISGYCKHKSKLSHKTGWNRLGTFLYGAVLWIFPAVSLGIYFFNNFETRLIIFIGLVWYSLLALYITSRKIRKEDIRIDRLTGRLIKLRRALLRFIQIIPFTGVQRSPFNALEGVSINMENGMFGLLGPNGAGKTTLMRIICGILDKNRGKITINGIDFNEKREELQGLIGYLPQEFGTYENMKAWQFLDYMAILKGINDTEKRTKVVNDALNSVHLTEHKDRKIKTFSGGMKQRIGIAMTLLHLPRILVVDEPTAGLDPRERIRFRNMLVELSRNRIVIFSTHIIEDISSSCNKVAVLNKGQVYYIGEPLQMTNAAQGKVWQFFVDIVKFDDIQNKYWIIHHIKDGDRIRIRCLSENKPNETAEPVDPTMEDAYIWLIGSKEGSVYANAAL